MTYLEKLESENVERLKQNSSEIARLRAALQPFADYADPRNAVPPSFQITTGSAMARKQLTMQDCYLARAALTTTEGQ